MADADRIEQRGEVESPRPVLDVPRDELFEEEWNRLLEIAVFRPSDFTYDAVQLLWQRGKNRGEAALVHGEQFYHAGREDLADPLFEQADRWFTSDYRWFGMAAAKKHIAWKEHFAGDDSRATEIVQNGLTDLCKACWWGLPMEGGRWTMPEAKQIASGLKGATTDTITAELASELLETLKGYTDYVGQSGAFTDHLKSIEQRLTEYMETGQVSLVI